MESVRRIWQLTDLRGSDAPPVSEAAHPELGTTPAAVPILLVGERAHRFYVFAPEHIEYIEADDNYVKFRSGNAQYISRNSMKTLALQLNGRGFVRIARSLLINVRAISYVERAGHGTFAFTLKSGSRLRSGATYRNEILRVIPLAQGRAATC